MNAMLGKVLIALFASAIAVAYAGLAGGALGKLSSELVIYVTFGAVIAASMAGILLVVLLPALTQARR